MTKRLLVYGASKLKHAEMWRSLRDEWLEIEFTARWPICHIGNIPDTEYYAKIFWEQDEEDVVNSNVVLVYAEPGENLRGALVEAGIAIGQRSKVILVGNNDDYGTWQYHPLVSRVPTMEEARILLRCMAAELPSTGENP